MRSSRDCEVSFQMGLFFNVRSSVLGVTRSLCYRLENEDCLPVH